MEGLRFLFFKLLTFKNPDLVFVTVFLTLCPYFSHSNLYISSFVMAPTFIFVFFQFLEN